MNNILKNILENTRKDLIIKKTPGNFSGNLLNPKNGKIAIIAEIKLASPTEKNLGNEKDILGRACEYEKSGADAVSFITEKSIFKGDIKYISKMKSKVNLPVLQKDFILDPIQIYEAKLAGADALLLIAKILSQKRLIEFVKICQETGLEPVVEINDRKDLERAFKTETKIIAVNARNLDTLEVDVDKACRLLETLPEKYIKLGFSGISSKIEVDKYIKAGCNGILIGTNLMKSPNAGEFLKGLI